MLNQFLKANYLEHIGIIKILSYLELESLSLLCSRFSSLLWGKWKHIHTNLRVMRTCHICKQTFRNSRYNDLGNTGLFFKETLGNLCSWAWLWRNSCLGEQEHKLRMVIVVFNWAIFEKVTLISSIVVGVRTEEIKNSNGVCICVVPETLNVIKFHRARTDGFSNWLDKHYIWKKNHRGTDFLQWVRREEQEKTWNFVPSIVF